jgi:hypothetical protein
VLDCFTRKRFNELDPAPAVECSLAPLKILTWGKGADRFDRSDGAMQCDYAFLSDFASDRAGYVAAVGVGIDSLVAPQVPATHPHIFLVSQLRCHVSEVGVKQMKIRLLDAQNNAVIEQAGQASFGKPERGEYSVARLVLGFYLLTFQSYGSFFFTIEVEGKELARLPFQVLAPPQQAGSNPFLVKPQVPN